MDSSYQEIVNYHKNSNLPKKKTKGILLTQEDTLKNRMLSSERVMNENVIGCLKVFKILDCRYRNRRKIFGLRFNLISAIYNLLID